MTWLGLPFIQTPFIFTLDRIRPMIPGMNEWVESYGAKEQAQVIALRMGEKQATYVPK